MSTESAGWERRLIDGWDYHYWFFLLIPLLALCVRFAMSMLRAWELSFKKDDKFRVLLCKSLRGIQYRPDGRIDEIQSDYLFTAIIGLFEIGAYPVLMVTGAWSVIGAWIAFKAVAQWKRWTEDRTTFIRFLIGTQLTLAAALIIVWSGSVYCL